MAELLKKYKLQHDRDNNLRYQSCLRLTKYVSDVIEKQQDVTKYIEKYPFVNAKDYDTTCTEWSAFVNNMNKNNDKIKIIHKTPKINHISTEVDIQNDLVTYKLDNKHHCCGIMLIS